MDEIHCSSIVTFERIDSGTHLSAGFLILHENVQNLTGRHQNCWA